MHGRWGCGGELAVSGTALGDFIVCVVSLPWLSPWDPVAMAFCGSHDRTSETSMQHVVRAHQLIEDCDILREPSGGPYALQ